MEIIRGQHNLRDRHRGCVLTIGNFDGVHRGHQALIAQARARAKELGLPLVVLSFEPTPREFFSPESVAGRVVTFRSRIALLSAQGVDRLVLQRFDKKFSAYDPTAFVEQLLVGKLGVRALVIGDDFRFGARRGGGIELLRELGKKHGYTIENLDTVELDGCRFSSTALRAALAEADVKLAAALLGRPYTLCGRIRRGLQLGRTLGMPTTNVNLHRKLALKQGIYAVRAKVNGRDWEGVASLGVRPTLGLTRCLLETHLFGEPGELYGSTMEVEFCRYLRPELKFDSLDALSVQMQRDADDARAFFASNHA
ncbi:bifunctional riboflavin kinase/FAD synthetase [Stenotrophobium rhamnosiphilum]|uniref:Riboflavin biosynthesis protein n=1 Tax=Stenotrophobium rhamnosiphilum TaxID=2029166 RepID=A0A2T5MI37_9GAMM|nr:bifunctional riboflavin kinase/FAD synthetase [Stenotrophobium rhamnosiphilum]PTU32230.1 bifunctional riboflavin kinase/FMN adenylyltransferase [Stenotrophobium rhamnosiphilum]